jgi:hypothetical protein
VRVEGRAPSARYAGTLITDAQRGRLLLFGGQGASAKADLWELVDEAEPDQGLEEEEPAASTEPPLEEVQDPDEV